MASVYFVRDGSGDSKTSSGYEVSIDKMLRALNGYQFKFTSNGPTISHEVVAKPGDPYIYVVIYVPEQETAGRFAKAGYYQILALTPFECKRMLPDESSLDT